MFTVAATVCDRRVFFDLVKPLDSSASLLIAELLTVRVDLPNEIGVLLCLDDGKNVTQVLVSTIAV